MPLKLVWKIIDFFLRLIAGLVMGEIGVFALLTSLLTLRYFVPRLGMLWTITAVGSTAGGFCCLAFAIYFLEGLISRPNRC